MKLREIKLHDEPVIWPEHKPLDKVLELKATTPANIWRAVYQSDPLADGGTIFERLWFSTERNRFQIDDKRLSSSVIARWISFDTGMKDKKTSAYSAAVVGELTPDYRLLIRHVAREKLQFPELTDFITSMTRKFWADGKLRGLIIEDKASGISAVQTLRKSAPDWLAGLIYDFNPPGDKEFRASMASVWAKNNCILFPNPSEGAEWLYDFEYEIFNFPSTTYADQTDAFSQLILWTENLLEAGWRGRGGIKEDVL